MNAKEATAISNKIIKTAGSSELATIFHKIKYAAKSGHKEVTPHWLVGVETQERLKQLGYKLDSAYLTTISWP